ncbi:MAG TPA: hypothetical protein VJ719_06445 [Chthoniobacterales bacterium]|nr:hypothetical protein [Chthoniobacterales bacterium]
MYRLWGIAILLVLPLSVAPAKKKHCMVRVHAEANPADTAVFSTSVKAQVSGKEVSIEKVARITEDDVVAFYPYSLGKGQFGVLLQLDEHGRLSLDALSVERRGTFLFIFINGRAITELQIDKRVTDGQLYIPSGLTSADIALMTKDWKVIGERKKRR